MNKENIIRQRLFANSILRQLKKTRKYEELAKLMNIPVPVLARYVKGHVLPADKRVEMIIAKYKDILKQEIKDSIIIDERGHFFHLKLLYNTTILQHIAAYAVSEFSFLEIDKILSTSTDGLPLAYSIGFELGIEVVYAKKKKEIGITDFIEQRIIGERSAYNYSIYVPEGSLNKNEKILIVDDAIRTGITVINLVELCKKVGAIPVGIFALISVGNVIKELQNRVPFPVKNMITLNGK